MNVKHFALIPAILIQLFGLFAINITLNNPFAIAFVVIHLIVSTDLIVQILDWAGPMNLERDDSKIS
jgi:hypothetical protein